MTVLPPVDPVVNRLGRPVATSFGVFPRSRRPALVDITIVALIAAGALAPDSPALNQVRGVVPHSPGTARQPANCLSRWASLLSGWARGEDPGEAVAWGVVVPPTGGTSINREGLVSAAGAFHLYPAVVPPGSVRECSSTGGRR